MVPFFGSTFVDFHGFYIQKIFAQVAEGQGRTPAVERARRVFLFFSHGPVEVLFVGGFLFSRCLADEF